MRVELMNTLYSSDNAKNGFIEEGQKLEGKGRKKEKTLSIITKYFKI